MGLSNKRIKASSVLGFVFMPQFRTMMPSFGHLRPILVRTLALMFEQAGLLSENHSSTQYGTASQGNATLRGILSEAWLNLRTQDGMGVYQYGLFSSIIMMIMFMIASFVTVIIIFSSSFITVAKAQLFDHPSGLSTSVVDLGAYAGPTLFDDRTPGSVAGVAPDLAIDILNKTLRQALEGNGGALQEGLASLLSIYSTGVMVIAALLIFWAVFSIIIDSMRSGYIGGGRHNISWVPIRFVFAMSLLVPWANGFNSGQVAVLQITEWGSNLASNGWATYVQTVANESLIVKIAPNNPEKLAVAAARNFTCAVAANAYLARLFDDTAPAALEARPEAVKLIEDLTTVVGGTAAGPNGTVVNVTDGTERSSFSWYYGNEISNAFCGGFDIPNPAGADLTATIAAGGSEGIIAEIKQDMRNAHFTALVVMEPKANELGCAFGNKTIPDFSTTIIAGAGDLIGCTGGQIAACGGDTKSFDDTGMVDNACFIDMVETYANQIKAAGTDPVRTKLEAFVQNGAAGGFLEEVKFRGWAGMGMWYHQISTLNTGYVNANDGGIKIIEPTYTKVIGGELLTKINNSVSVYDNWWANLDKSTLPDSIIGDISDITKPGLGRGGDSAGSNASSKDIEGIFTGKGKGGARVGVFLNILFPSDGFFVGDLSRYGDGIYPLAALSGVAMTMWLWIAGALLAVSFMVAMLSGIEISFTTPGIVSFFVGKFSGKYDLGDVVLTVLGGPFGILLQALSGLLIMSTLLLLYVVPMLPWLRVTFGVMSWIMTVFEAVVMVPVVALAHLRTEGEGLMGPLTKGAYILWLNLLLRPILMVIGFVAALLVFNAMTQYINNTFSEAAWGVNETRPGPVGRIIYSVMYVGIIYTIANSAFKAIDIFPNATMKWLGGGGGDRSFYDSKIEALVVVGESSGRRLGTGAINSAYGGRFGFRRLTNWRKSTASHKRKMKTGKEFGDRMAGKARKHGL